MLFPIFWVFLLYNCHTVRLSLHVLYPFSLSDNHAMLFTVVSKLLDDESLLTSLPPVCSIGIIDHSGFGLHHIFI